MLTTTIPSYIIPSFDFLNLQCKSLCECFLPCETLDGRWKDTQSCGTRSNLIRWDTRLCAIDYVVRNGTSSSSVGRHLNQMKGYLLEIYFVFRFQQDNRNAFRYTMRMRYESSTQERWYVEPELGPVNPIVYVRCRFWFLVCVIPTIMLCCCCCCSHATSPGSKDYVVFLFAAGKILVQAL